MVIAIHEQRRSGSSAGDSIIRTISTRIAGGGKVATAEPSQVWSLSLRKAVPCVESNGRLLLTNGNFAQAYQIYSMRPMSRLYPQLWSLGTMS